MPKLYPTRHFQAVRENERLFRIYLVYTPNSPQKFISLGFIAKCRKQQSTNMSTWIDIIINFYVCLVKSVVGLLPRCYIKADYDKLIRRFERWSF